MKRSVHTMKTLRPLSIILVLAALAASCRDVRGFSPRTEGPAPHERRAGDGSDAERTLAVANDAVEAARIFALGVPTLPTQAMRGIALPLYTELPDLSYAQMLSRIAAVGATHVSIVTSWNQQTIFHNRIAPNADTTPTDDAIGAVVDRAHELGLKVMLFPILHIERRAEGEWRGKLAPTHVDDWRESYRQFILHHADLARRHGVDVLSVGSELSSQEGATEFWTGLIGDVRAIYAGKLIYSANWDHYTHPKFWDQLDFIGVSSYFEVARRQDEPLHVVTDRWVAHRATLLEFARDAGLPLILTEVGYPAVDSAAVKPWDYTARTAPNPNAQLAAFHSLASAWNLGADEGAHFGGLYIWHGWGHGGPTDLSYPIWGKSSEPFVRRWFSAPL